MVCDNCRERDAVVHLTQIVENAVTRLHLCEKCAAERGVETTVVPPKNPLGELLRRVHGSSRHVGRRYEAPHPEVTERTSVLLELRERLRRAIEAEQFELA